MYNYIVYIYRFICLSVLQSLPGIAVILISLIFILKFYNVNSHLTAESCGIIIHYSWKKKDSEKDKENAQMHALLGTICQIKKNLP